MPSKVVFASDLSRLGSCGSGSNLFHSLLIAFALVITIPVSECNSTGICDITVVCVYQPGTARIPADVTACITRGVTLVDYELYFAATCCCYWSFRLKRVVAHFLSSQLYSDFFWRETFHYVLR